MLEDQVVIVTGGCGLIGSEFVRAILQNGGRAVIADIDTAKGEMLRSQLTDEFEADRVMSTHMDICSKESVQKTIADVSERYGRIDALVNNAYPRNSMYGNRLEQVTYDDFCENISLNLGGLFLSSQQFALFFQNQGGGNIINIASIYGVIAPRFDIYEGTSMTMPVEYAAIKSAVIHLTKYFARYFKGSNLRVNCISPGGIKDKQPAAFLSRYEAYSLNEGMLDSKDISGALVFLLSDSSKYINGQNIVVDDGWSI